jgi:signal transduction histidine kinase
VLCLSQIEKGVFRQQISKFDVREAIEEVILIQRDKAEFQNINLHALFSGFEDDNYMICTDKMRLKQVILNYQSNALKFSRRGGQVTLHCRKNSDGPSVIEIEVTDTGYGIDKKDFPKIFQLYGYLQDKNNVNSTGIGLGLYLTKKIVHEFSGQVIFKYEVGRGSTFKLSFLLVNS